MPPYLEWNRISGYAKEIGNRWCNAKSEILFDFLVSESQPSESQSILPESPSSSADKRSVQVVGNLLDGVVILNVNFIV